jgi:uncharacterized protein (TIGR00297 family)
LALGTAFRELAAGMRPQGSHSETARQVVHMSMGGFALLLRWLAWWQAIALAATALLFNVYVLPKIAGRLYRPHDDRTGLHGIVWYPISVVVLLLCFPRRPDIVAGAWGVLAIGDGAATLVGRALGGPRWPWNREKTVFGSLALVAAGGAAALFLSWWCRPAHVNAPPHLLFLGIVLAASVAGAAVETVPVRLDDNLSVALIVGAVLWIGTLVLPERIAAAWIETRAILPVALLVNTVVALAGYRARTVSISGAIGGAIIGTVIFAAAGWRGWLLLFLTFIAAAVTSRLGLQRKTLLGIAEAREGRRGAGNAIANTGVAMVCACLALLSAHSVLALLAFVTALAAGGSDTIASEIGKALGSRTWSIVSLKRVPPGTSGAMSLEGTAAGIVGALALGAAGSALHLIPPSAVMLVVIGATAGSLLESWLGATLEAPGIVNNDVLNFMNTAAASIVAVLLAAAFGSFHG